MRVTDLTNEMTPWRAVALWAQEEFRKLGHKPAVAHVTVGPHGSRLDLWCTVARSLGLELRCSGEDFRLCELADGVRTTLRVYEYADPNCFDHCRADIAHHDEHQWARVEPTPARAVCLWLAERAESMGYRAVTWAHAEGHICQIYWSVHSDRYIHLACTWDIRMLVQTGTGVYHTYVWEWEDPGALDELEAEFDRSRSKL